MYIMYECTMATPGLVGQSTCQWTLQFACMSMYIIISIALLYFLLLFNTTYIYNTYNSFLLMPITINWFACEIYIIVSYISFLHEYMYTCIHVRVPIQH